LLEVATTALYMPSRAHPFDPATITPPTPSVTVSTLAAIAEVSGRRTQVPSPSK
jgi:hypothetical protein